MAQISNNLTLKSKKVTLFAVKVSGGAGKTQLTDEEGNVLVDEETGEVMYGETEPLLHYTISKTLEGEIKKTEIFNMGGGMDSAPGFDDLGAPLQIQYTKSTIANYVDEETGLETSLYDMVIYGYFKKGTTLSLTALNVNNIALKDGWHLQGSENAVDKIVQRYC